jgi:hypothetical protein
MMRQIKVGILVSYDYELIKNSLPPVYEYADKIVLAVDKDGKTWSGNSITIAETFWDWVKDFDMQHKIEIYKDSFYVEELTSVQNDTRERNMLGKYMGEGGWHVQIDADEYFIDFGAFVDYLHELDRTKKHVDCIIQEWLLLYKKLPTGYLLIKGNGGQTPIATTRPDYICCRIIAHSKKAWYPQRIIHDSWARSEEDLLTKLTNWGHNKDFNTRGYFHYWKAINEKNYMFARNFHPYASPETWGELDYIAAKDIPELLHKLKESTNDDLLKATKRIPKVVKFIKMCIPPVLFEIYRWYQNRRLETIFEKQSTNISSL